MMRLFITSWRRPGDQTTLPALQYTNVDWTLVLHTPEDAKTYANMNTTWLDPKRIVVSHVPPGLVAQREFIRKELVADGEWVISADDNLQLSKVTAVRPELYDTPETSGDRADYKHPVTPSQLLDLLERDREEADRRGAHHVGYAVVDNPFFRMTKYRDVGYCIGKCTLIHKVPGPTFRSEVLMADDFLFTAEHLLHYGRVLVNNYLWIPKKHYSPGGIGPKEERLPNRLTDCRWLHDHYAGLFRFKERAGDLHPEADLALRFHSLEQVAAWRPTVGTVQGSLL